LSVEPFDPGALTLKLDDAVIAELIRAASDLEAPDFGMERDRISALSALARHDGTTDWRSAVSELDSGQIVALVKFFTLAERLPGWEAGARSPVIPMAAVLKARGDYPDDLTGWIKAHTDNRFLPYGSLMDRL
jgi:hypothetical protein